MIDLSLTGAMAALSAGMAARICADLIRIVRGEPGSISTTTLDDTIYSHFSAFWPTGRWRNGA